MQRNGNEDTNDLLVSVVSIFVGSYVHVLSMNPQWDDVPIRRSPYD